MSFPKYEAYKDSGVEWLGEVPEHWDVMPIKRDLEFLTSGSRGWAEYYSDEGSLFIRIGNLTRNGINLDLSDLQRVAVPEGSEGERTRVRPDDVLFSITAYLGSVAVVPDWLEKAYVSQHVALARFFGKKLLSSWVAYIVLSQIGKDYLASQGYGGTKIQLALDDVANLVATTPSLDEQTQIARFLDHETAKIDALIAEQQRLIALLKEKRQAVISHAVTEGLDPAAPMKDSGVEWLGQVPTHWVRKRLKNVSPFIAVGIVVNPSSYISEEGLPFLYGGEVKEGYIELEKARKISPESSRKNRKTMLEAGDIVTMRVGYPGLTAVVPPECEGGNCASVMLVKHGDYNSQWLCGLMNSRLIRQQVEMVEYGAAQKQFNISDAVEFWLFEPPKAEQTKIADFIKSQSSVFDALIAEANNSKALLSERRSALISAAVTGKIDVRGWQAPASASPAPTLEPVHG